jgi:hypothetical protein
MIMLDLSRTCTEDVTRIQNGEDLLYVRLIPDGKTREQDDAERKAVREFNSWFNNNLVLPRTCEADNSRE